MDPFILFPVVWVGLLDETKAGGTAARWPVLRPLPCLVDHGRRFFPSGQRTCHGQQVLPITLAARAKAGRKKAMSFRG